ncbi:alpha/beta fold hydrolase [Bacillus pinisoli]|uniref:alpha/beta fold hydrolase n=1 Tax=Bacillus pinisoli TaxID=2901866 RepID=UPI001FF1E6C2|nr:alpha/beta hydrolase [Bacillus pinisoli]
MLKRHSKKVNNVTMSYIDEGSGDPIVLIHGFCGSPGYFEEVIPLLSKNHRVIAPALRGHGKSSAINEVYTIDDMAEDIKLLLEELNLNKVKMFGHSLGGYVTLAFAGNYPEILSSFGLVHSTAFPDNEDAKEGRLRNIELICESGIEPLINNLVPKLFSPQNSNLLIDQVQHVREIGLNTSVTGAKGALRAMRERPDRNEILIKSNVPILLIAGEDDQIIPVEKVFSHKSPLIRQVVLEGVGHLGMIEDPGKLSEVILDFTMSL